MESNNFSGIRRSWVEPAHNTVLQRYGDLKELHTQIRDKFQVSIDKAFDTASKQIGFVVTTSLPVTFEIVKGGRVKSLSMGTEGLKNTLFEKAIQSTGITEMTIPTLSPGKYETYLIWYEALRLRLKTDWMEPAHQAIPRRPPLTSHPEIMEPVHFPLRWDVMEPVHWFDPRKVIPDYESVLISVIDEVYPELRLVERIASSRQAARAVKVRPEVQ